MPLPLPQFEFSMDGFETMLHRIGWKHEYWAGQARLSPAHTAVACLRLDLRDMACLKGTNTPGPGVELRSVLVSDEDGLIQLHIKAFDEAVEYAGHDEAGYRRSVTQSIQSFFGVQTGGGWKPGDLNGSCVVVSGDKIIGALLLRKPSCPFRKNSMDDAGGKDWEIAPVMVDSDYQREGVACAMLAYTCDWLRAKKIQTLGSRCHLSNTPSLAWHSACGFVEQPTSFASGHRAHHHCWMHHHHQAAGRKTEAKHHLELAELHQQLHEVCSEREFGIRLKSAGIKT